MPYMAETILCECGMIVKGTTKKHLKENLKKHVKGKKHKELQKFKRGK